MRASPEPTLETDGHPDYNDLNASNVVTPSLPQPPLMRPTQSPSYEDLSRTTTSHIPRKRGLQGSVNDTPTMSGSKHPRASLTHTSASSNNSSPAMSSSPATPSSTSDILSPASMVPQIPQIPLRRPRKQRPTLSLLTDSALAGIVEMACVDFKAYQAAALPYPEGLDLVLMSSDSFERVSKRERPDEEPFAYSPEIRKIVSCFLSKERYS